MNADDGSHGVKHVDEQEGEHHGEHVPAENLAPLEFAEDGGDAVGGGYELYSASLVADKLGNGFSGCRILDEQADDGGRENADKHAAAHLCHHETGGDEQTDHAHKGLAFGDAAKAHEGGVIVDDDTGVLHAYEGDEQADTRADGLFQGSGNSVKKPVSDLCESKDDEEDTLKEDGGQCKLPAVSHSKADGKHEECIQTHAGSEGKGLLCIECHHQRTDDGGKSGCCKNRTARHAG